MESLPGARCSVCPLANPDSFPLSGSGPDDAEFIYVGDSPGSTELFARQPLAGNARVLLDAAVKEAGGDVASVFHTNIVACKSNSRSGPSEQAIACCLPRLKLELKALSTKKVVAAGLTAHRTFGVPSNEKGAIYDVVDKQVMPTWNPSYILQQPAHGAEFLKQIDRAVNGPFVKDFIKPPERNHVKTLNELQQALDACPDGVRVSFDIETDQVVWFRRPDKAPDPILMMQICWTLDLVIILTDELFYDTDGCVDILQKFFDRVQVGGQNLKFDCVFVKAHLGLVIEQHFDTMLAHYALDENSPHGLKVLVREEFGVPDYEATTISKYLSKKSDRYSKIPTDVLAEYGALDVVGVLLLWDVYEKRLREQNRYEMPFQQILMAAANKFVDIEIRGIKVDRKQLTEASKELGEICDSLKAIMRDLCDKPDFNPNSPQQVAIVLFDDFGLPEARPTKKLKARSTNKDILERHKGKHPFIKPLREYRRVAKMRSSYVDNMFDMIDCDDRVHATFSIPGTEVGRLAVRKPALQTIPRPDDYYGALVRSSFIPGAGKILVCVDYSQAELRVFAVNSGDPFLLDVYEHGRDLHSEVAIGMYGNDYTKVQRVQTKMFNFSYLYGGNKWSFAQDAGLNIRMAEQFVDDYDALMPVGKQYKRDQFKLLKEQGYVESVFGRRRHFPLITSRNKDEAKKACVHMPTASAASDLTLLSGIEAEERWGNVVLMVHDEVIIEADLSLMKEQGISLAKIMEEMGDKYLPGVPWKTDIEEKSRWAEQLPRIESGV